VPDDWQAVWEHPHDAVDIPGHHFSIVEEHAESTAAALDSWIGDLSSKSSELSMGPTPVPAVRNQP
jgi:hypothetical protein